MGVIVVDLLIFSHDQNRRSETEIFFYSFKVGSLYFGMIYLFKILKYQIRTGRTWRRHLAIHVSTRSDSTYWVAIATYHPGKPHV